MHYIFLINKQSKWPASANYINGTLAESYWVKFILMLRSRASWLLIWGHRRRFREDGLHFNAMVDNKRLITVSSSFKTTKSKGENTKI